jgi:tRNA (cytidine/uridine-2'-O-)-methyltransferase
LAPKLLKGTRPLLQLWLFRHSFDGRAGESSIVFSFALFGSKLTVCGGKARCFASPLNVHVLDLIGLLEQNIRHGQDAHATRMPQPDSLHLRPHRIKVALLQPQIAPNTGNIARACVAAGAQLHLVRPMGFILSDRNLRRSAMDYWPRLQLTVHDDSAAFFNAVRKDGGKMWLFSTKGKWSLWEAEFTDSDWLIFGGETTGISAAVLGEYADRAVRIPQVPGERCLNLSTAVAVALFESLRQVQ